jgi:hypothetical protein
MSQTTLQVLSSPQPSVRRYVVVRHSGAHPQTIVSEIGFWHGKEMKADRVEVSRENNKWLIRIQVGEEVVRRHADLPADADESSLRIAAAKTTSDEGYTVDPQNIVIV